MGVWVVYRDVEQTARLLENSEPTIAASASIVPRPRNLWKEFTWIEPESNRDDNVKTDKDDTLQPVGPAVGDDISHGVHLTRVQQAM